MDDPGRFGEIDQAGARQLAAMSEIGRMRDQEKTWAFTAAWPLMTAALCWGLDFGLLFGGFVAAGLAGAFSRFFVKWRSERIVALVAAKHGLRSESLEADKFLID